MEARLVVISGKTNRSEIHLKLPTIFGRGRDADITIAHAAVSRHHCKLEEVDGALVLRDNGSTNGTFFGKKRVKEMVIRPGDLFSIGPLTFRAEYEYEGPFPDIGEPRPEEYRDDATIQFTPGQDASTPPDGMPIVGSAASGSAASSKHSTDEPAEELDFLSSDEPAAAQAKAESGIDFLSDAEPAAEPEPAAAEAANGDAGDAADDDFLAAFQEDDPIGASLSEPAEEVEDDHLLAMDFDEPAAPAVEAEEAEQAEAADHALEMEADEPHESVPMSAADDSMELDFDLDGDAAAGGDREDDTAETAVPPPEKPAPAPPAVDDEPQFAVAGVEDAEFDPFADDDAPAPAAADGLADLDGAPDEEATPVPNGGSGRAKGEKPASIKAPAGKGKAAKDKDAKKGWWPFGKGEKKSAKKSGERKEPVEHAAAAELPELEMPEPEMPEPEMAAVEDDAMPDFFEAAPAPSTAKPAASKPAAAEAEDLPDFLEDASAPPPARPAATKAAAAKPAAAKPAASKPAAAKPAAAKPHAAEPDLDFLGSEPESAAKPAAEDDGLDDFFQDLGLK